MQLCRTLGIDCHVLSDALLNEPEEVLKSDQTPYQAGFQRILKPVDLFHRDFAAGAAKEHPVAITAHQLRSLAG